MPLLLRARRPDFCVEVFPSSFQFFYETVQLTGEQGVHLTLFSWRLDVNAAVCEYSNDAVCVYVCML
jgi:hypothetical protein